MNRILTCLSLLVAFAAWGAIPEGYYSAMEGKKKADLKAAAKSSARKHTVISYGDDTWDAFEKTDTRTIGGSLCWWDMYSSNNVKVSNGHPGMNIEHSVANSWWGGTKNDAYKDLFHLNPSDAEANNRKSNYPLGIVKEVRWSNGVTTVGKPASGTCDGAENVYEPADEYKGDFARAFFYMFTIYDDITWSATQSDRNYMFDGSSYPSLRPWAYKMLLQWAANDPVDNKEIARNEAIYSIQKNRNPFIDFPDLAEYIWGSKTDEAFSLAAQHPNPDPIDPDDPENPDPGPGPNPGIEGSWNRVTSAQMLDAVSNYIIVSVKDNVAMGTGLVNGKAIARAEDAVEVSESGVISSITSDVAIVRLHPAGTGYAIELSDTDGNSCGYLTTSAAKAVTLTDNGTTATITPRADFTEISFGSEIGSLQYNASSPRFAPYTSVQQRVYMYRKSETSAVGNQYEVKTPGLWFDLTGRPVNPDNLQPGLYIHAGRKILIRR